MVLKITEIIFLKPLAYRWLIAYLANVIIIVIVVIRVIATIISTTAAINGVTCNPLYSNFTWKLLLLLSHSPWTLTLLRPLVIHTISANGHQGVSHHCHRQLYKAFYKVMWFLAFLVPPLP